ncbi:MAG: hypothetical protein KF819_01360 [Labilithrix sp.]|nr:hypothetical protein [Labilithrix sp.]
MRASIAAMLGAALLLASRDAAASPEDLFGYGARTSAMGATGTAYAGGYESAWHNPALASEIRAPKLTLGYTGGVLRLDAVGLDGVRIARREPGPIKGTVIGAEIPIPFGGALRDRVGISLAFYQPTDVVVRGRVLYPEKPQFPMLDDRGQSVTIRAGVGADIGYGIKLGVGFAALAEIVGNVVAATDATGRVGTQVETQLVATYAPSFAVAYDLPLKTSPEKWTLGLVFRGTLDARFGVEIDGTKLSSLQIPLFNISGLAQYDPGQIAVEIARREEPPNGGSSNVLALQLVYKRWSSFPGVLEPTVVCTEGGAGACGLVPPKIDWSDTIAIRLGADQGYALGEGAVFHVRGGTFYETSPLPSSVLGSEAFDASVKGLAPLPTRYYDSDRIALTAGAGLSLSKPLPPIDLDLFAQFHQLVPRAIRSTDAAGNVLAEAESSGSILVFGMNAGVKF